ncbi:MAG: hypothetical protein R8L58_03245 [Mariprofundaceae bacterium]
MKNDARHLIGECKDMLEQMTKTMHRRQWHEAAGLAAAYAKRVAELKGHPDAPLAELMRLELIHRRTMRWLARQMQSASHDIESLEQGGHRLQQGRRLLQLGYQQAAKG